MSSLGFSSMIDVVKEITIAKIANSPDRITDAHSATDIADFMQVIYDKLNELNTTHRQSQRSDQ